MLETLGFGMVEIDRAGQPHSALDAKEYEPGSYVIRMQQPYSSVMRRRCSNVRDYPDLRMYPGGPPRRPYDVTAQTLPLLMGVTVDTISQPFQAALERADHFAIAPNVIESAGRRHRFWRACKRSVVEGPANFTQCGEWRFYPRFCARSKAAKTSKNRALQKLSTEHG